MIHDASAIRVKGRSPDERIQPTFTPVTTAVSAGDTRDFSLLGGLFRRTFSAAGDVTDHQISLTNVPTGHNGLLGIGGGAYDDGGVARNAYNERAAVTIGAPGRGTQVYRFKQPAPDSDIEATGHVSGTLGEHVMNAFLDMVSGITPSKTVQRLYSSQSYNGGNPSVTWNDSLFFDRKELLGMGLFNSNDRRVEPVVVSGRHALLAHHVTTDLVPGTTRFVFELEDGSFINPLVTAYTKVGDPESDTPDIGVLYFDQELPFTPYKTMPPGWINQYAPAVDQDEQQSRGPWVSTYGIPILRKSAHFPDTSNGECFVFNFVWRGTETSIANAANLSAYPLGDVLGSWGADEAIPGDSGGPSFFKINEEFILVSSQQNPIGASNIAGFTAEINAIMNAQASAAGDLNAGSYVLQHPDLSAFTDFSA